MVNVRGSITTLGPATVGRRECEACRQEDSMSLRTCGMLTLLDGRRRLNTYDIMQAIFMATEAQTLIVVSVDRLLPWYSASSRAAQIVRLRCPVVNTLLMARTLYRRSLQTPAQTASARPG